VLFSPKRSLLEQMEAENRVD